MLMWRENRGLFRRPWVQTEGQGQGFGGLEVWVWYAWLLGVQILAAVRQVGLQEVRDKELHEFMVLGFRWCPCAHLRSFLHVAAQ